MPRVSQETMSRVEVLVNAAKDDIFTKCLLCPETLTHLVKTIEAETGAGTATVARFIAARANAGAALGDRVSEVALRDRVKRAEGVKEANRLNNTPAQTAPRPLFKFSPVPMGETIATKWTGDHESYTPAQYVEAARRVMGSIDTDPASSIPAQEVVKAGVFFTKEDDGLKHPWNGNIFLNPPYSHPEIKHFVDKLLVEIGPGKQAILLTNNNTDTRFFHDAAKRADAICFTRGRINFNKPDGSTSSPTNGQVFFYFGENKEVFTDIFADFGIIMEAL